MLWKVERTMTQTLEIEEGKKETKGRKDFLHLSHVIMEYNISTRMNLTLRDYIGQFES
jgi:hypothetical protein